MLFKAKKLEDNPLTLRPSGYQLKPSPLPRATCFEALSGGLRPEFGFSPGKENQEKNNQKHMDKTPKSQPLAVKDRRFFWVPTGSNHLFLVGTVLLTLHHFQNLQPRRNEGPHPGSWHRSAIQPWT